MRTIGEIEFRKIKRISPSQYYSMKNCAYKSVLSEAFGKKPLLPISPNAYFGVVLHKMLELITKGVIRDEDNLNKLFDTQVILQETNLKQQGYEYFVPLQKNVNDYGIKKILLKKHLRNVSDKSAISSGLKYLSEKWYESQDKLIAGIIDLVIEGEKGTAIIDFKTGAIAKDVLDDDGEVFLKIKEEYKDQLKLYAQLYFENTGIFPIQLILLDMAKHKIAVDFSQAECKTIYEQAKILLHTVNDGIDKGIFTANTSEANCKYCLYRPACSYYLNQLKTNYHFNDVSGSNKNVVKYQNGNVNIFLENSGRHIEVTGISSEEYAKLNEIRNKQIYIFNLRKEAAENVYSATKTTMIYE